MKRSRWLVAGLLFIVVAACGGEGADVLARPRSQSSPRPLPDPPGYQRPRPPGPPLFVPHPRVAPRPDSPDLRFEVSVAPYSALTVGDRFTVSVRVTNLEGRVRRDVAVGVLVGDGVVAAMRRAPGAAVDKVCDNHDPVTGAHTDCREYGVKWRGLVLQPRATRVVSVEVEILDFACPSGGDFIHVVRATIVGPVKRGPNGGVHRIWYENDPEDYAAGRAGQAASNTGPPHRGCFSESVEN